MCVCVCVSVCVCASRMVGSLFTTWLLDLFVSLCLYTRPCWQSQVYVSSERGEGRCRAVMHDYQLFDLLLLFSYLATIIVNKEHIKLPLMLSHNTRVQTCSCYFFYCLVLK